MESDKTPIPEFKVQVVEPQRPRMQMGAGGGWLGHIGGAGIVLLSILILTVIMDRIVMPLVVRAGIELKVPDLHRLQVTDADSLCRTQRLELVQGRTRIDARTRAGTVLDQFPVAGSVVKPGRRVEVVVSERISQVSCPDFTGLSVREAQLSAGGRGLVLDSKRTGYQHSSRMPMGVILAQKPSPQTMMNSGDSLSVVVSLGETPTEIVAPELVGLHLEGVDVILARYGLKLGEITRYPTRAVEVGTIVAQVPAPGTVMKRGESVTVQLAATPVGGLEAGGGTDGGGR